MDDIERVNKLKVTKAQIVVNGNKNRPYFSIEYTQASDGECYLGFGSYNLNFVFDWYNECIEIVSSESEE